MMFKKRDLSEWHDRFAWLPTEVGEHWIWMKGYQQRLVDRYWLSADGTPPLDGAACFVFERKCDGASGQTKIYRSDC